MNAGHAAPTTMQVPPVASLGLLVAEGSLEQAVLASMSALVCVIDAEGRIALFNPALERATGWSATEVLGRRFCEVLVVPSEADLAHDAITRSIATGHAPPQEGDWLDRWGGQRRVAMQNSVLRDGAGRPIAMVCVGADVTDRRLLEAQLRDRANTDVLTGLRNRAALFTALNDALADSANPGCGLLFCDLDGFKEVNDTHGHDVGDRLLREVAARLLDVTRDSDVVARLGGDEFVVLSPGATPSETTDLAERVSDVIARPFATRHGSVIVGVSVGVALSAPGEPAEHLLAAADRHMYGIKTRRSADRRGR